MFRKGEVVHIINTSMSGRFFIEGQAKVVRAIPGVEGQYLVCFKGETQPVERFVDPRAQIDTGRFVADLNAQLTNA
jgi:hypothetical protein